MGRHEGTDEFPGLEAHASPTHLRWVVNLYTCLVQDPHSRTHIETKPGDNTLSDANTVTSGLTAAQGRNIALDKPGLIRVRLFASIMSTLVAAINTLTLCHI